MRKKLLFIILLFVTAIIFYKEKNSNLPIVAIANYGPHSSLEDSIKGIKEELASQGFIENKNIQYDISDVGFDSALIPQMVTKLYSSNPTIMVAMTTPVAQFAKHNIKNIPLIFNVVTDPVEAGLLKNAHSSEDNMTCTSDMQNLDLLLDFAKKLIPQATRVGLLYSTAEANDSALMRMLEEAAKKVNIQLVAIPIDQPRDIPIRIQGFKDKVDFIYVGTSGPIQPALPMITAMADKMNIPIFNVNEEAVQKNQVLASFGVSYLQIGKNTGSMIANLLRGGKIAEPIYPMAKEHQGFISKKKAEYFGIKIPSDLTNVTILE
jgi:putative ABC transport system substrate-binding protein